MPRLVLRPSVLGSLVLHVAVVGAAAFSAGRGAGDHRAVVLGFESLEVGAAFDAPEVPVADPPPSAFCLEDAGRLEDPVVVEPTVTEPPLPPDDGALPPEEPPTRPDGDGAPIPAPSMTARTRPARVAPVPAPVGPVPAPAPLPPPSTAQRAGASQVSTFARAHPTNRPPRYPDAALRSGWQGVAWLIVDVGPDGRVASVVLERSSGYEVLDAAAVEAVAGWTYDPRVVDGVAAPDRLRLPVRFTSGTFAPSR